MRILILTRKYPPKIGGMEKQSFEIIKNLKLSLGSDLDYIYLNKGQIHLIWWLPLAFLKSLWLMKRKNYDIIHVCDGALAPLGWLLKILTKKIVTVTIHGLDITYKNSIYQLIFPYCVKKLDCIFCVSKNTAKEAITRCAEAKKITVIPNGINPEELKTGLGDTKSLLSRELKSALRSKKIILTVGRLVKRKGVSWFIREVFPKLKAANKDIVYIIIGKGKEFNQIRNQIIGTDIFLMGEVNQSLLKLIYNSADCLVMPNIPVEGDFEGFGIVAVEASSLGVPVVASNVDGISDAVIDGRNGFLVQPMNAEQFSAKILQSLKMGKKQRRNIQRFTEKAFSWKDLTARYLEKFMQLNEEKSGRL